MPPPAPGPALPATPLPSRRVSAPVRLKLERWRKRDSNAGDAADAGARRGRSLEGAEQRRRAQPRGARARPHSQSDSSGQSERRKRQRRGRSRGTGERERARRAGGPRGPAPSAGSRTHALTAGGRASCGRRPRPGLVGGKGGCCLPVACCCSSGTAQPSSPRPVFTDTRDLAGWRSLRVYGRCPQNE